MLPSWGVGKSIGLQHLSSTCRHVIGEFKYPNSSSQNSGQYSLNCSIKLTLAEHHIRLKFAAKSKTCILAAKFNLQLRIIAAKNNCS